VEMLRWIRTLIVPDNSGEIISRPKEWVKKSKLLILSAYVNKTEKIGGVRTNTDICREMEHCLIFSRELFYVTIVLCLSIL